MTALQGLAWLPVAVWAYLLLFRGRFWLPDIRLGPARDLPGWPTVAVIVPARDEAAMLASTMPALAAQDYPGRAAIFLVDDCSGDSTREVAAAGAGAGPLPLTVVTGADRPEGWVGKTWALAQGVRAASEEIDPDYFLFTDADIHHPADSVRRLVSDAVTADRDLVSLMARLRTATGWERLVVPAFVYFFSQLYPFRSIARRRSRTAGAAGGCILLKAAALRAAGGVEAISGAVIDDVALGRAVKRSGGSIWLGFADEVASLRPYQRLADLWDMVARSAYTQLRYSPLALAATVVGLAVIYLGPLAALLGGAAAADPAVAGAGLCAQALMTASYLPMIRYYRLPAAWSLTLPAAAALYGAMTVDSARRHRRGVGAAWKGRTYAGRDRPGVEPDR